MAMSASQLLNGTYGTLSYDGVQVAECLSCKAKVAFDKEDVDIPGQLMTDTHVKGASGSGSLEIYKISSQFVEAYATSALNGEDPRSTLVSSVTNKSSGESERIQLTGVSFDDVTLADWSQKTIMKKTLPFTFTGYDVLDSIDW